jgi:hypothetical protein
LGSRVRSELSHSPLADFLSGVHWRVSMRISERFRFAEVSLWIATAVAVVGVLVQPASHLEIVLAVRSIAVAAAGTLPSKVAIAYKDIGGLGVWSWDWTSNDQGGEPDVVMASARDIPTQEALGRNHASSGKIPRSQNPVLVVDLFQVAT